MIHLRMDSHLLLEEAEKRKIKCTVLGFDQHVILMEKNGKMWYTKGSRTSFESSVGQSISERKEIAKLVLEHFSIPSARYKYVKSDEDLSKIQELVFPLVMKPVDGSQGKGVIVGIEDLEAARKAFSQQSGNVLFEEFLHGEEYRIICVDFKFVAASKRYPASVIGNGKDTIQELVDAENKKRQQIIDDDLENNTYLTHQKPILFDEEARRVLQESGFNKDQILAKNKRVFVRKNGNLSTGGEAWDVTDDVSEENRKFFEKVAHVFTLNTVGIDVMCSSLSRPINEQKGAGIIEVNDSPGLRMHHFPAKGKPRNIAAAILDMVERKLGVV